jgi:hypothetical protein
MGRLGHYAVEDRGSRYGPEYTCTICQSQFDDLSDVEEHCRWDHICWAI